MSADQLFDACGSRTETNPKLRKRRQNVMRQTRGHARVTRELRRPGFSFFTVQLVGMLWLVILVVARPA